MQKTRPGKASGHKSRRARRSGGLGHSGQSASARTGVGRRHTHKFTIGDRDAFITLLEKNTVKLEEGQRERLARAVQDANRRFKASSSKEREAFLHGLMTGYAVAFKLTREGGPGSGASPPPPPDAIAAAGGL